MIVLDKVAYEWRRAHYKEIVEQVKAFAERGLLRSNSKNTVRARFTSLSVLCGFMRKTPNEILDMIRNGDLSPYDLLNEFVAYLHRINAAPYTIRSYVSMVKKWLRFNGITFSNEELREWLEMPKGYSVIHDRIPTPEELKKIFLCADLRGKVMISMLVSSGMRIGELLNLKVGDIDFSRRPTTIHLRSEITKDRQERYVFISDEATQLLKQYLGDRINDKHAYIFQGRNQGIRSDGKKYLRGQWRNKPMSYYNAVIIFRRTLERAGLRERDEKGHDLIRLHSLRKYFFSRMTPIIGREVTEALMGHKLFLDASYRRWTVEELAKHYLKGMDAVTILIPRPEVTREDVEKIALLYRWLGTYDSGTWLTTKTGEEIIEEEESRLGRPLTIDEKINLLKTTWLKLCEARREQARKYHVIKDTENISNNDDVDLEDCKRYQVKIVKHEADLVRYLEEGWELIKELSGNRFLIRRRSIDDHR